MNKKDRKYWEQHKEVLNRELEKLDVKTISNMFEDPHSSHSRKFAAKVDTLTKKELELS